MSACEIIESNIIENEVITSDIIENEVIEANIIEAIKLPSTEMTYTIDFGTDQTLYYGIFSKHFGNITKIETTNIASYTIDGAVVTPPQVIEINTTYLFEIVKETAGQVAQMVITVTPEEYTEDIDGVDFITGNGRYTYLLGNNTDVTTNRTLLKFDNDLFTIGNWTGSGWTFDPLIATITLPELPTDCWYRYIQYIKDDYILAIATSYYASADKAYYCKINISDNTVTDLDGNTDQYTDYTHLMLTNGYPVNVWYNYVDNFFYLKKDNTGDDGFYRLNLNDNSYESLNVNMLQTLGEEFDDDKKITFNPYNKTFYVRCEIDPEYAQGSSLNTGKTGRYIGENWRANPQNAAFNRHTKEYYKSIFYSDNQLVVFNEFSQRNSVFTAGGAYASRPTARYCIDHENEVVLTCTADRNNFVIFRIADNNKKAFAVSNPSASQTALFDPMFAKDNLFISLGNKYDRLFAIDASDPEGTAQPDFGYYDLPIKCWSLHTNRLI